MIAYIEGTILFKREREIIVVSHGLGYAVTVPPRIVDTVSVGDAIELYTHQHVREDALDLYGFESVIELDTFRELISVNGVGPKVAVSMLSAYTVDQLHTAIIAADTTTLSAVSGVGKKTAERIILDLKDRIAALPAMEGTMAVASSTGNNSARTNVSVIDALVGLGYSQAEAVAAIQGVDTSLSVEDQIREALKRKE